MTLASAFESEMLLPGLRETWSIMKNVLSCQVVHGKAHFTSWHAKAGLTVFILSIVAPLGGIASFRKFGLLQRVPEKLQPRIKWAHRNVSPSGPSHPAMPEIQLQGL